MARVRNGLLAAFAATALFAAPAHATQLVTNGNFEADPGDGSITGWSVSGVGVADDQVFFNSATHDAIFTATSDDLNPGVLSQDLATTPGGAYTLQFALMNEGLGLFDNFFVSFGGFSTTIGGLDVSAALTGGAFTPFSFNILGADITGTTTTLTFQGVQDPTFGSPFNLDDVSVTPAGGVPEPDTWALMIAGFGMLGYALRRRPLLPRAAE